MKKWVLLAVILCAAGAAAVTIRERNKDPKINPGAPVETIVEAKRGPIRLSVSSTGRVVSNLDVDIKCKASGQVTNLPYDVSDPVKKGALLVELDPVDEERRERQAQADLASSQAKLEQAQRSRETAGQSLVVDEKRAKAALKQAQAKADDATKKAERMKQLLASKGVGQEEYDTAQTTAILAAADFETAQAQIDDLKVQEANLELKRQDVKVAEAQVESNKVNLELAKQRLTDTKVYAPIDSVVSQRNVQIGQIIASPISNVSGGTPLLTLSDLSRIFVVASVDESDIGKVLVDQPAAITADAFPQEGFTGKVTRIATQGASLSNVVTFEVQIEVLSKNKDLLKPQMTANVEIVAGEKEDVLQVPTDAVYRRKGQRFVVFPAPLGQKGEERVVQVGLDNGVEVEVVSGLSQGERVIMEKASRPMGDTHMPGMMFGGGGGKGK